MRRIETSLPGRPRKPIQAYPITVHREGGPSPDSTERGLVWRCPRRATAGEARRSRHPKPGQL